MNSTRPNNHSKDHSLCFLPLMCLLLFQSTVYAGNTMYWPEDTQWEIRRPESAGFDARALDAVLDFAGKQDSTGMLVMRKGYIVAERYWKGWDENTPDRIFSTSKSIIGTLIGMAIDDGKIRSVDQPAADFVPAWRNTDKQTITIRHLLSMTSGLGLYNDRKIMMPVGVDAFELMGQAPLEHPPGTAWVYHSPAYRVLARILENATGETLSNYQQRRLLGPLGMRHTSWETLDAPNGRLNYLWMRASVRDMARFGLLILRGGEWRGQQLVSRDYLTMSTRKSQSLNPSYGFLWWLGGEPFYKRPDGGGLKPGPMWPDCPRDAVGALGAFDKKIYVIPSLDLVVVRHGGGAYGGGDPAGDRKFDNELLGGVCKALRNPN
jgi:CubicO group peptidase (beta-lactamase class C family)